MDSFDKKIKSLYPEEASDLPQGLAWDDMKDGIFDKMEKKDKRYGLLIFWGLSGLALIVISAFLITFFQNDDNSATSSNTTNQATASKTNENSSSTANSAEIAIDHLSKTTNEETLIDEQNNTLIENNNSQSDLTNNPDSEIALNNTVSINTINIDNKNPINTSFKNIEKYKESHSDIAVDEIQDSQKINQNNKSITNNSLVVVATTLLSKLPQFVVNTPENLISPNLALIINNKVIEKDKIVSFSKNSLIFSSGYTQWSYLLDQDQVFQISDYESPVASWNANLVYNHLFNKYVGISTGLQYSQLASRFENEFITTTKTESDSIPVHSYITGLVEYQSGEVTSTEYRNIVHYNYIHAVGIPVQVLLNIDLNKSFSVQFGTGVKYFLYFNANGKTINEQLDLLETSPYKNKGQMSLISDLRLNYKLKNNFYLTTLASYEHGLNNWTRPVGGKRTASLINMNLGFGYKF